MKSLGILALVICAAYTAPVVAQEQLADTMEAVREKAQADKRLFVADNLQLTESEAKAFWPVYERYQHDLQAINARLANLIRDYGKNAKTMSDEVANRLTTEAVQIEVERTRLAESYLPSFRQALPGKKLARYYQLETKIRALFNFDLAKEIPLVQ
jgi:hypothetical protein